MFQSKMIQIPPYAVSSQEHMTLLHNLLLLLFLNYSVLFLIILDHLFLVGFRLSHLSNLRLGQLLVNQMMGHPNHQMKNHLLVLLRPLALDHLLVSMYLYFYCFFLFLYCLLFCLFLCHQNVNVLLDSF